jgi:hypothetical protein
METKQRIDESGFSGAVRSEQPDGAALQNAGEPVQYRSATELHFELIKLNGWGHHLQLITD